MVEFIGALFVTASAWLVWAPFQEMRYAARHGHRRLSFSRMLLRIIVSGCIFMIGAMILLYPYLIEGRSRAFELFYLSTMLLWALVMLVAGAADLLLIRREDLLQRKEVLREFLRGTSPRSVGEPGGGAGPDANKGAGNGSGDQL